MDIGRLSPRINKVQNVENAQLRHYMAAATIAAGQL
jgi:hypothetical protein